MDIVEIAARNPLPVSEKHMQHLLRKFSQICLFEKVQSFKDSKQTTCRVEPGVLSIGNIPIGV